MKIETVHSIYFSPSGTTKKITLNLASCFSGEQQAYDLLDRTVPVDFGQRDVLVAGVPVFAGRIPSPCVKLLKEMRGNNTPAVAVAVYGNRAYEYALLELQELLEGQGFAVLGAGAFIGQHSIFPDVGAGRPDETDMQSLQTFGAACRTAVEEFDGERAGRLHISGALPSHTGSSTPLIPSADGSCTGCGACARRCPVQAIDAATPQKTNQDKCIFCTACIAVCPQNARAFRGPAYQADKDMFVKKCAVRKEPEWFLE